MINSFISFLGQEWLKVLVSDVSAQQAHGNYKCGKCAKDRQKLRIAGHKVVTRNNNLDYTIARHYKENNHESAASLRFYGIEKISPNPRGAREIKK